MCKPEKMRLGSTKEFCTRFILILLGTFLLSTDPTFPADKKEKTKTTIAGVPKLWGDPGDIASKDLYWGPGSESRVPKPPFKFVEEDLKGTNPKVRVTDADGTKWVVKFENKNKDLSKVHAEPAATRIVWAFGYMAEEEYFVPAGTIQGVTGLKRAKNSIGPDGSFKNARFKTHPDSSKKKDIFWDWNRNPFAGTKELSGLKILMALLGNWDTKTDNNDVLEIRNKDGQVEDWYLADDVGTAFGKMGIWPKRRTIWNLEDYQKEKVVEGVQGDTLILYYIGKASIGKIPLEHARWFAGLLSQLTQTQVKRALEAAGGTQAEIDGYSSAFMAKIKELQSVVRSPAADVHFRPSRRDALGRKTEFPGILAPQPGN